MSQKPLIVLALEAEGQGIIETLGFDVIYCGVGKINAAYHLTKALAEHKSRYPYVLNIGSAGSPVFKRGELVACHEFVQRDMDATGIGFSLGKTPFDESPALISFPKRFPDLPHGICGSGDSFLQGKSPVPCDVIDMEAYALAKICLLESIPFAAIKYITDGADEGAGPDWQQNLAKAAQLFHDFMQRVFA